MDRIVVEYSLKQKAFHKQTFQEMLDRNLRNVLNGRHTDYLPIAIFDDTEEADLFISYTKRTPPFNV